jgi:hypothetical protein
VDEANVNLRSGASDVYVLMTAAGYEADVIRPLIRSLVSNSPSVRVVIFVDRIRQSVRQLVSESSIKIELVRFPLHYRLAQRIFRNRFRLSALAAAFINCLPRWRWLSIAASCVSHPASYRFIAYRNWIRARLHPDDRVWMLDSRDVLITRDLSMVNVKQVTVGEEHCLLGDEPTNLAWLFQAGYDVSTVTEIADKKIICSGVVGGQVSELERFLNCYESELIKRIGPIANRFGFDQAIVMALARASDTSYSVDIQPYESPYLVNLGSSGYGDTIPAWVRGDGSEVDIPTIVHQYDRIPEVTEFMKARFDLG